MSKLHKISVDNQGQVSECLWHLILIWLDSDGLCSWQKLIDALREIDKHVITDRIANDYCEGKYYAC